ncbi:MAG TPA: TraR/DksA family transcriptional regulator [Rhodospirillales bacterium]|nr:TraR/DksA family transcriptional regulator [Rhodospirillales bacterium]
MAKLTKSQIKNFKALLEAERDDLRRLAAASEEDRKPVELDQTTVGRLSRMDAMQNQAMALETGRRREQELRRVEAALARIEGGAFGACAACGEDVELKRLKLDPATPICIGCAH